MVSLLFTTAEACACSSNSLRTACVCTAGMCTGIGVHCMRMRCRRYGHHDSAHRLRLEMTVELVAQVCRVPHTALRPDPASGIICLAWSRRCRRRGLVGPAFASRSAFYPSLTSAAPWGFGSSGSQRPISLHNTSSTTVCRLDAKWRLPGSSIVAAPSCSAQRVLFWA